jgi:eukaryotic-like serine/threonine-protein kinase
VPDERWQRVKTVLGAALERPAEAREAFLREACGEDDGLRREVESLLAARTEAGDFLSEPARLDEAVSSPRLATGMRLGPYEVVSFLGAGGMGEVYKAKDTRLDRTVAIKVLRADATHPEVRQRFEREARTVSQLSHPHICALYDVGQHDGASFLVMEYLEGETLAHRLGKGPVPLEEALPYATQIAEALEEAHQHGIVHRDLKPANVVLTRKGAKLLDFGIAKLRSPPIPGAEESTRLRTLTREGLVIGTLQYMAPEQLEGQAVDERTDVFAFGLVVYEMVSGRRAFEAPSVPGLFAAILKGEPPPLSRFQPLAPSSLEAVVQR